MIKFSNSLLKRGMAAPGMLKTLFKGLLDQLVQELNTSVQGIEFSVSFSGYRGPSVRRLKGKKNNLYAPVLDIHMLCSHRGTHEFSAYVWIQPESEIQEIIQDLIVAYGFKYEGTEESFAYYKYIYTDPNWTPGQ
jgi:hypothetical protein